MDKINVEEYWKKRDKNKFGTFKRLSGYKIRAFKENVRDYIKPQNKRLRKVVPAYWRDKDALIEEFLFMAVITFMEDEKPFEVGVCYRKGLVEEFMEVYEYAKKRTEFTADEDRDTDTKHLHWIVENRGIFWT